MNIQEKSYIYNLHEGRPRTLLGGMRTRERIHKWLNVWTVTESPSVLKSWLSYHQLYDQGQVT